jgi:hypothetical protein
VRNFYSPSEREQIIRRFFNRKRINAERKREADSRALLAFQLAKEFGYPRWGTGNRIALALGVHRGTVSRYLRALREASSTSVATA